MKHFFINQFPISYSTKDGNMKIIDIGSSFVVSGINGDSFELMPVKKIDDLSYTLLFGVQMIDRAFKQQDHSDT